MISNIFNNKFSLTGTKLLSYFAFTIIFLFSANVSAQEAARTSTEYKKNFGGAWVELGVSTWCNGKGNKIAAVNALEKARKDRSWRKIAEYEMDKIMNPQKYQN